MWRRAENWTKPASRRRLDAKNPRANSSHRPEQSSPGCDGSVFCLLFSGAIASIKKNGKSLSIFIFWKKSKKLPKALEIFVIIFFFYIKVCVCSLAFSANFPVAWTWEGRHLHEFLVRTIHPTTTSLQLSFVNFHDERKRVLALQKNFPSSSLNPIQTSANLVRE